MCSFILVLEGKTGKEIPESLRLEFLEKFSAKNFALSDAADNNSRPLNREDIASCLCLCLSVDCCDMTREVKLLSMTIKFTVLIWPVFFSKGLSTLDV